MVSRALMLLSGALLAAGPTMAQGSASDYRDEFLEHFERSTRKLTLLSAAIPDSLYRWSPGAGTMSVARVYAHIARYNYLYLDGSLGIPAAPGVDWQNFESITEKAQVQEVLAESIAHVRTVVPAMRETDLTRPTMLYGRRVPGWAVLFQLLAHMNEHVGQSVAYARMNSIVPPWSR